MKTGHMRDWNEHYRMTPTEAYQALFFALTPTTLAAIALDLDSPEAWPSLLKQARVAAVAQGEACAGEEDFAAYMAEEAEKREAFYAQLAREAAVFTNPVP